MDRRDRIGVVDVDIPDPLNIIPAEMLDDFAQIKDDITRYITSFNSSCMRAATGGTIANILLDMIELHCDIPPINEIITLDVHSTQYIVSRRHLLSDIRATDCTTADAEDNEDQSHSILDTFHHISSHEIYDTFINIFETGIIDDTCDLDDLHDVDMALCATLSSKTEIRIIHMALQLRFAKLIRHLYNHFLPPVVAHRRRHAFYTHITALLKKSNQASVKTSILRHERLLEVTETFGQGIIMIINGFRLRDILDMKAETWRAAKVLASNIIKIPAYQTDLLDIVN